MRIFRRVFIFAILIFSASAAHAQSQKVLADGNPPLTQTMVGRFFNLLEWSLDLKFSAEDRAELQTAIVGYWKNEDAKSMQSIDEILAFEQKWRTWTDAQKQQSQAKLRQMLLESIEKNQTDSLNRSLLAIYRRQHDSNDANNLAVSNTGGSLADLVGRWQFKHGNSLVGVNRQTGQIGGGNGMIAEYDIRADGRVIYSYYMTQTNYGCTTRIKTSKTGRAAIEGSRITFAYSGGTTTSEDSCNAKYNYTKTLSAERETLNFNLSRDENGRPQFCFANGNSKDCATRQN